MFSPLFVKTATGSIDLKYCVLTKKAADPTKAFQVDNLDAVPTKKVTLVHDESNISIVPVATIGDSRDRSNLRAGAATPVTIGKSTRRDCGYGAQLGPYEPLRPRTAIPYLSRR
jgi:hypothetical protein